MRFNKLFIPLGSALLLAFPVSGVAEDIFTPTEIIIGGSSESSDDVFAPMDNTFEPIDNSNPSEVSAIDSMRKAINYSPALRSLRESRTASQYDVDVSMGNYLPSIDLRGSAGYGLTSNASSRLSGIDEEFHPNVSAAITVTQSIFNGFGVKNAVELNHERVISMDNRVLDNASSVALEALVAHSEIIRLRDLLISTSAYVDMHLQIIGQLELLVASGINTTSDVFQAQGRLVGAQVAYQNVRNSYELALIDYKRVTGMDAPENLLPIDVPSQEILDMQSILALAEENNPQILALMADYEGSKHQVGIARAGYFPSISLDLQATYDNDQLNVKPNQEAYTINASVGATWNIFNGFATENARRSANASVRYAQQALQDMKDEVLSNVKSTYEDYVVSENLRFSYNQALLYNVSTRDSYMSQFRFGTRPLLDLLDAESELYGTEVQLGIMTSNRIISSWRLLALQGTMLEELGIDSEAFMTDESNEPVSEIQFSF